MSMTMSASMAFASGVIPGPASNVVQKSFLVVTLRPPICRLGSRRLLLLRRRNLNLELSPDHAPEHGHAHSMFMLACIACPSAFVDIRFLDSALPWLGGVLHRNVRVCWYAWYRLSWFGFSAALPRLGACPLAGCGIESEFQDSADASMYWRWRPSPGLGPHWVSVPPGAAG